MIFIFLLIFLLINISFYYTSSLNLGYKYLDMFRNSLRIEFVSEINLIIKFIYLLLVIFITILYNLDSFNNLAKYLIHSPTKKIMFFSTKIAHLSIVALLILFMLWLNCAVFMELLTPFNIDYKLIVHIFLWSYMQGLIYIFITNLIFLIFNNIIIGLAPIVLIWVMETNNDVYLIKESYILRTLYDWIPNLINKNEEFLLLGYQLNYWILLLSILFFSSIIYLVKDIN